MLLGIELLELILRMSDLVDIGRLDPAIDVLRQKVMGLALNLVVEYSLKVRVK